MFTTQELREAAEARRAALGSAGTRAERSAAVAVPCGASRSRPFAAQLRAKDVEKDGKSFVQLDGYASAYERSYDMWDFWGPYTEVVSAGAGSESLASSPDVSFLLNHKGMTMARTTNGTLTLSEDDNGLRAVAELNPKRGDIADLLEAIRDGVITEMSFAFRITDGQWSPDYTEYRINSYDINRGDVSAVNYGANPHTSIEARSAEFLEMLGNLEGTALRAAHARLSARLGVPAQGAAPVSSGPSVAFLRAQLEAGRI